MTDYSTRPRIIWPDGHKPIRERETYAPVYLIEVHTKRGLITLSTRTLSVPVEGGGGTDPGWDWG